MIIKAQVMGQVKNFVTIKYFLWMSIKVSIQAAVPSSFWNQKSFDKINTEAQFSLGH